MKLKLERSLPFFNALLKAQKNKRMEILHSFPVFVVDDLIEVLHNLVLGKVNIGKKAQNLKKHKKILLELINMKGRKNRRGLFFKQTGGFITSIIPMVLQVLSSLMG